MENPAFKVDSLELPPPTEVSPTPKNVSEELPPQNPIILNPTVTNEAPTTLKRGMLTTFGLLLAGWFVGNLIIMASLAVIAVGAVGSTGLVKVPVLTSYLFGKEQPQYTPAESFALDSANTKLAEVRGLAKGETINNLELSQDEINALLDNQINSSSGFPIGNQHLQLTNDRFVFTGNLISTDAPVEIVGSLQVSGLTAQVSITKAKFGKLDIPVFLASNIVDSNLSKIGLSLSGSSIPAQSLKILDGKIVLQDVSNPSD